MKLRRVACSFGLVIDIIRSYVVSCAVSRRSMGSLAKPHMVMVSIFAAGHATPFLLFAMRLAAEGVTVTFVSSDKHIAELILRYS